MFRFLHKIFRKRETLPAEANSVPAAASSPLDSPPSAAAPAVTAGTDRSPAEPPAEPSGLPPAVKPPPSPVRPQAGAPAFRAAQAPAGLPAAVREMAAAEAAAAAPAGATADLPLAALWHKLNPAVLQLAGDRRPDGRAMLRLPIPLVQAQLAKGSFKIPYAQLRQFSPEGLFPAQPANETFEIEIPVSELLPRLKQDQWRRRSNQKKIEVPDDIAPIFGPDGGPAHGVRVLNEKIKSRASAAPLPAAQPTAQPAAPATIPPADIPAVSNPPPVAVPAPAPVPSVAKTVLAPAAVERSPEPPVAEPEPSLISARGLPSPAPRVPPTGNPLPSAPFPPPKAPVPLAQPPPLPRPQSGPAPAASAAPPAPVSPPKSAPAAPARPALMPSESISAAGLDPALGGAKVVPFGGMFTLALQDFVAHWSEKGQPELASLYCHTLEVPMPIIEMALKAGKVQFKWREMRAWVRATPGAASPSVPDETVADFPLALIAPRFLEQKRAAAPRRRVEVSDEIPNVFAIEGAAAEPPPAVPPAPAASEENEPAESDSLPLPEPAAVTARAHAGGTAPGAKPVLDFGEIFGQPDRTSWSLAEVADRASSLRGVAGAVIATSDGLLMAGRWPQGVEAESVAGFVPQIYGKVIQYARELRLPETGSLILMIENVPLQIFKTGDSYFTVLGRASESLPKAQLSAIATRLAAESSKS